MSDLERERERERESLVYLLPAAVHVVCVSLPQEALNISIKISLIARYYFRSISVVFVDICCLQGVSLATVATPYNMGHTYPIPSHPSTADEVAILLKHPLPLLTYLSLLPLFLSRMARNYLSYTMDSQLVSVYWRDAIIAGPLVGTCHDEVYVVFGVITLQLSHKWPSGPDVKQLPIVQDTIWPILGLFT